MGLSLFFWERNFTKKQKFRPSRDFEGLNLVVNSSGLIRHSSFNTLAGLVWAAA
jgi:hypothetical protein